MQNALMREDTGGRIWSVLKPNRQLILIHSHDANLHALVWDFEFRCNRLPLEAMLRVVLLHSVREVRNRDHRQLGGESKRVNEPSRRGRSLGKLTFFPCVSGPFYRHAPLSQ